MLLYTVECCVFNIGCVRKSCSFELFLKLLSTRFRSVTSDSSTDRLQRVTSREMSKNTEKHQLKLLEHPGAAHKF